ncbi:MAG: glycosyltransferase [bacterium]|nr:glycosyltransferase [bacterium]
MDCSIVIPALNERDNIGPLLQGLKGVLDGLVPTWEVVVVDGGSTDGTVESARRMGAAVIVQTQPGYGGALKAGFEAARGEVVITMDADLSHDPAVVRDLWASRGEADLLIASRYVPGGRADMTVGRLALSRVLNVGFAWLLALPVKDLSSGFRLYHRSALERLPFKSRDFDVLVEILIHAYAEGFRVREVPFHYRPRRHGRSHVKLARFARSYLVTLLRMWQLRHSIFSADHPEQAIRSWVPLQRAWHRRRLALLRWGMPLREGVLNLGCGSNLLAEDLGDWVGAETSLKRLRRLARSHTRLVKAAPEALPFRDAAFAGLVCAGVLEHWPTSPVIVPELLRVLRPGGRLCVAVPDAGRWRWRLAEWVHLVLFPEVYGEKMTSHYTSRGLIESLEAAGAEVMEARMVYGAEVVVAARKPA